MHTFLSNEMLIDTISLGWNVCNWKRGEIQFSFAVSLVQKFIFCLFSTVWKFLAQNHSHWPFSHQWAHGCVATCHLLCSHSYLLYVYCLDLFNLFIEARQWTKNKCRKSLLYISLFLLVVCLHICKINRITYLIY